MTPNEAIEWLLAIQSKYIHGGDETYDEDRKLAIKTAISALEKQIPKKPIEYCEGRYCCPECKGIKYPKVSYCEHCGQALSWEGDSE